MRIFEYVLPLAKKQLVSMPEKTEIISVSFRSERLVVSTMQEPSSNTIEVRIDLLGHYDELDRLVESTYLGTLNSDGILLHAFMCCEL